MATKKIILPGEPKLKNLKHELFCVIYAGGGGYYFGNATRCYLHAFGREAEIEKLNVEVEKSFTMPGKQGDIARREAKNRIKSIENTARANGHVLLTKTDIRNRTAYLLDRFLSDDYADREMAFVIAQREDLMAKVAAYREVAKVKERVRGAGAISGEFTFAWEDDDDTKKTKAPVLKKATVRSKQEADEGMVAEFA